MADFAMCQRSGLPISSSMVQANAVHGALNVTLTMNFSQMSWLTSANAWTLKPASRQTLAMRSTRGVSPPFISPMRISFMLL